ncbi:hypothetical protein CEXT_210241 [Caerostris extrusa]|uniref:Uncharacterized protein n=1 Tax=Caerostris extrusa TaxID=172846 RepID=A0AAV4XL28_CAEEX|nr:hypothetical protein CEXT_210241 [Caerostris extrusa]
MDWPLYSPKPTPSCPKDNSWGRIEGHLYCVYCLTLDEISGLRRQKFKGSYTSSNFCPSNNRDINLTLPNRGCRLHGSS